MNDYLELYKKFNDVKEISDYIDEVKTLRFYYSTQQFEKMQNHIYSLTKKYFLETIAWNSASISKPTTYTQSYINAENFMLALGAKLIVSKVVNYRINLTDEEISFIESMI